MSTVVGGGDPAVNWHPTPGVVEITVRSLETRICNDMMVHETHMQTLPFTSLLVSCFFVWWHAFTSIVLKKRSGKGRNWSCEVFLDKQRSTLVIISKNHRLERCK